MRTAAAVAWLAAAAHAQHHNNGEETDVRRQACCTSPARGSVLSLLPVGAPAQVRGHGGKSEETPWLHLAAGTGVLSQVESELKKVKDLNEKDNRARQFRSPLR